MDFLRGFFGTRGNLTEIPTVQDWFSHMEASYLVLICMSVSFSLISIVAALVHLLYVLRYISNETVQSDMYWIVFMCPVVSLCGSIGMILPRSAIFLYAVALVYFMICIFVMVTLMTTLHGSRSAMCEKLVRRNVKISVRVMPLGCCFFCFPKIEANETNFRKIEWLVFQSPLVRIFLEILNIMVFFELGERTNVFFQISNLIGMLSLFVGSYGSYMIIPVGSKLLKAYRFQLMFRCVDLTQLAYSVQKFTFDFFAAVGVFQPGPLLPDTSKAQFYACFLLTVEMLFLSIMATIWFRPSQTIFFDKYKRQFEDENVNESSLGSNEDAVLDDNSDGTLRIDNLPLRAEAEDVYVVDGNGNNYTKRTITQSTDDGEDTAIQHNDSLTLLEQCKQKNELLLEYGDDFANEAGLAINTWCLSEGSDESSHESSKHTSSEKSHVSSKSEERIITIDEDSSYYGPYLRSLNDEQLSEVQVFVRDRSLSKQEILAKLESYSKEHKLENHYKQLTVFIKERETTQVTESSTVRLSEESQRLEVEWKAVIADRNLTAIQSCQRKNELIIKFEEKIASELGYQPNNWCMNLPSPPPVTPVVSGCSCNVTVSIEESIEEL